MICSLAVELIQRDEAFTVNGRTHTRAHTRTHTHTHTHTRTYTHTHIHTYTHSQLIVLCHNLFFSLPLKISTNA